MLARRAFLKLAGSFGAFAAASDFALDQAQGPMVSQAPSGSCDAHVHVIGDPRKFPMSPNRDYTPPAATVDELIQSLKTLGFDRVIIVTPTVYDTDNSATLDAIRRIGQNRARGIALIDEKTRSQQLHLLEEGGIVGIRVFLNGENEFNLAAATKNLKTWFELAEGRGWHLDISTSPDVTAALLPQLKSSPVPLVFDYFGWVAGGIEQPGFGAVLSLVKSGRAYVKLSEPYRLSKDSPDYEDLIPVVRAYVAANPDRVLWGSGWPHVDSSATRGKIAPNIRVSNQHLFQLFETWVRDPRIRQRILVDNPARLYGF